MKTDMAARYLGVSRTTLVNWLKKGHLGSGSTPGGHYRFSIDELKKFAKRRRLPLIVPDGCGAATRILLIDEDEPFRSFVKEALEVFKGFELREATDGMMGAILIGSWRPDLILLDIRPDNMDGLELLRRIRENPVTSRVEVVALSSHITDDMKSVIKGLGVAMTLEKPVRLEKLVAAV